MVLQKSLYYGFNGLQAPYMPRGIRSVRGKGSARNNDEQKKMHAFELLATVAGKLLLEEEFPASDNLTGRELEIPIVSNAVKQEKADEKVHNVEHHGQGSYDSGRLPSKTCHKRLSQKFVSKECSQASNSLTAEPSSVVVKPESSLKAGYESESEIRNDATGNSLVTYRRRPFLQRESPQSAESHVVKMEDVFTASLQIELPNGEDGVLTDLKCLDDPLDLDSKTPNLVSSDSSVEVPSCHDNFPGISSFPDHLDDMELVDKDNDENSSRFNQPCTATSKAFKLQRVGDRRIRKLLASKFWKVGPTLLNDGEFSNIDSEPKSIFCSRKMCYRRHKRMQRPSFRRRKLFDRSSVPVHSAELTSEVLLMPSVNSVKEEEISHTSASNEGQRSKFMSENYQVKFSIKSLKLPELFIEMPESATVGELKRTVLETLTAILHNGLRVGVIFQGKKVRDDNKTLLQSGIAQGVKLENLGFSLEPNTSKAPQITIPNDSCYLEPCDASKLLTWLPTIPSDLSVNDGQLFPTRRVEASNNPDNNLNLVPFANTAWSNRITEDSDALAVVPAMNLKALAAVPANRKLNRSELVQRRIRRPFSVSEVEALVQAVEKLGTGRWRDVKLRAFDKVNHRTYVDLKDKWKTLVHTAKISPQQRRGEPVPQELLDRVLSAHAYWSQHQAKLQNKQQQQSDHCLLI